MHRSNSVRGGATSFGREEIGMIRRLRIRGDSPYIRRCTYFAKCQPPTKRHRIGSPLPRRAPSINVARLRYCDALAYRARRICPTTPICCPFSPEKLDVEIGMDVEADRQAHGTLRQPAPLERPAGYRLR